jgi:hypothetical protein
MNEKKNEDLKGIRQLYQNELGFDLCNEKNARHSFYKNYQSLIELDPKSEEYSYILFHNLFGPIEYLNELKKLSEKKYKTWKKRIVQNTQNVGIYGDLFELHITWSLVMKKIDFISSDSPDFEINYKKSKLYIECTSSQFNYGKNPSKENILQKIVSTIQTKMKLNYATTSTCLFVDITNLCYHAKQLNSLITKQELTQSVYKASQNIDDFNSSKTFGAIMFFWINTVKDLNGNILYATNSYDIIQNVNADPNLIEFLKQNNIDIPDKQQIDTPKFNH